MNRNDIMKLIEKLALSQGFYTRIYNKLLSLKTNDFELYNEIMEEWERLNFETEIDFVLYLEG